MVLIRGNGSPRSFRLRVPALQRTLFALSLLLSLCFFSAILFGSLYLFRSKPSPSEALVATTAPHTETAPQTQPSPQVDTKNPSLWQSVSGMLEKKATETTGNESESQKEIAGLREENAKLNAKIEARKPIEGAGLVQFFGPSSVAVSAEEALIQVKNAKISRVDAKNIALDFELHNTDPGQKQVRGYIIVLAKSADAIAVYPANAFSTNENILVNFTKGETFSISRFRAAHASFSAAALEGRKPSFQIVLFRTDGKVLATQHVEGKL